MKKSVLIIIFIIIGAIIGFIIPFFGSSPSPECPVVFGNNGEVIGYNCTFWNYTIQFFIPNILLGILGIIIGLIISLIIRHLQMFLYLRNITMIL